MKLFHKYLVLSLALLITISASGISISLHRCCGSIKHFSFLGLSDECKMAKRQAAADCPLGDAFKKQSCCTDQKISLGQRADNTVATSTQVKEKGRGFDVLFFYTLFKSWFGASDQQENIERPSPGLYIVEALILLLQQFRL
jgi:hypothetical protein